MADDGYEAALDSFIQDLNRAFRAAGPPTYSQLQQVSERLCARGGAAEVDVLTRSNTHDILHGRRHQPPKWHWVLSFVTVLRAIAGINGIPADSVGSLATWKRKYDAVRAAADLAASRPASAGRHRKSPAAPGTRGGSARDIVPQQRDAEPEWPDIYLCFESTAKVVRTYEPRVIPALLQVEGYARAIAERDHPGASASEIASLVELRMRRQELLSQPGFQLWAVIEQAALRNQLAGPQTMRSQITHLINVSERANVTLQVLLPPQQPELDDHVTIKEPITHFRFPEEHVDDVIVIERHPGGVILTDRQEIAHYSQLMSRLGMRAARADDAQRLLRDIFMEL